jgi:hypothetical protein
VSVESHNGILTGKTEELEKKSCLSATSSTTNPTWTDPGTNLGLRGKRLAPNRLNHDMAYYKLFFSTL